MSALTVTLGADITALKRAMAGATELVAASARRMGKMTSAGLAGSAAAMGVGVKAVNSAADFEQTKVAFTRLIGDAAKAEQTLAKLRKLGAETPFEFPELADADRKLSAFGESADTVPETLRRIGDVSAGIQAPINEIAEVYLQAGMEWVVAHLLKGLLKIPGIANLLGLDENAVETNFGKILKDRKETGADLFGFTSKDMADSAANMIGTGAPALGDRVAEAARKAWEFGTNDLIDTTGLRDSMGLLRGQPNCRPRCSGSWQRHGNRQRRIGGFIRICCLIPISRRC